MYFFYLRLTLRSLLSIGLLIVILSKNIDEMCKFTRKNDFKTVRHRFFKYNIGKMVNISIKPRWKYLYCKSTKVEAI